MPALQLQGIPDSPLFWCGVALVLSYGAYVAEVFRAGIDSIHPSQVNSATALGLSRAQAMRHVVVPQAVRRVIPPLLNDFVSLQKDTALVASAGVFDALFAARDYGNYNFNYTPIVVVAGFYVVDDRAAGPLHRLAAAPLDGARAGRCAVTRRRCSSSTGVRKAYGDRVVLDDIDLQRRPPRRRLPDRLVRAPASRRCCAASTCSSRSTTG